MVGFMQKSDGIYVMFLKDSSSCHMQNGSNGSMNDRWETSQENIPQPTMKDDAAWIRVRAVEMERSEQTWHIPYFEQKAN